MFSRGHYITICAAANGGGYFRSGVGATGSVTLFEPKGTEKVQITHEILTINVGTESADVTVEYKMQNLHDKKADVEFGFPVENLIETYRDDGKNVLEKKNYCEDYRISIGGKDTSGKIKWDDKVRDYPEPPSQSNVDSVKGVASWLVSNASFAAKEEKQVMIHYRSPYPEDAFTVSENSSIQPRQFVYRLSSGACWAGPIAKGRIVINIPEHIDPREVVVIKPVNRFKRQGNQLIWEFENLEPTLADDLVLQVCPAEDTYYDYTEHNQFRYIAERGKRWEVRQQNYKVKASSTKKANDDGKYDPSNLVGFESWCEGSDGNGVGEWLEITPDVPTVLRAFHLFSEYQSSENLAHNARPKRMTVVLNDEKSYDFPIPDSPENRYFLPNYAKPVHKIKITFTEVYEGKKTKDMYVRGLSLVSGLSKKPVVPQCR